jgi:hypothetical protein
MLRTLAQRRLTTYKARYRLAALLSFIPLPLSFLLNLFGSDKQRPTGHSYGQTYHELFGPFRRKRAKLLEIGVLRGESLLAWRGFFPRAAIIGCDIEPKAQYTIGHIRTRLLDQSSEEQLRLLVEKEGPFDIVIDDGSHLSKHQIFTFRHLFDHLRDGGVYIVEDVQTSFWHGTVDGMVRDGADIGDPNFAHTCIGYFLEMTKYLNYSEFLSTDAVDAEKLSFAKRIRQITFEHNLVVVRKGRNIASPRAMEAHAPMHDMARG